MEVGKRIKEVREREGLTQSEFAERIGKSQMSISQNELGNSQPRSSTLRAISEEFGVSYNWLLSGTGERTLSIDNKKEIPSESGKWSEKAFDAIREQNAHLLKEVQFLRELVSNAMNQLGSANFLNDFVLAGENDNFSDEIVRVAA